MNEEKELKLFNTINEELEELSKLIIQNYNIKHHCHSKETENWLTMRITAINNSVTEKIKTYNNNIYKRTRRK